MTKNIKITVVGDGIVGKTCMLIAYTRKEFPEDYVPTVFEHYGETITVDGESHSCTLWDTAGQEDYERLRPLSYPNTDCFLICFSVVGRDSYENVITKWTPEVRYHIPHAPILLVATKTDLRNDPTNDCLTTDDGKKLRRKVKADGYVECSAKEMIGLEEVFETAVRICIKKKMNPKQTNRLCTLL